MFLLYLFLVTEEDLNKKIDELKEKATRRYEELYSIEQELETIKSNDQKLRNRISYIANEKTLSYKVPKQTTFKLPNSDVSSTFFSKTQSIEFFNENQHFIKSIHIDFTNTPNFPNEFGLTVYIGKETIEYPKQNKRKASNIVFQTAIQPTK